MTTVVVFVIILGALIFVHELGHFLTAKKNGIKTYEFGFGFPPRIFGVQLLSGKEWQKKMEVESIETEMTDIKIGGKKIIKKTITEKLRGIFSLVSIKKWRWIWGSHDGDDANEKKDLKEAHEKHFSGGTIYSLNWIFLGGFVKIKGEDGSNREDSDSFAGKPAWVRIKVLLAGVIMNFVLAWFLISLALMIGSPETTDMAVENNVNADTKIQISEIIAGSPAELSGLEIGDEIVKNQEKAVLNSVKDFQNYIENSKGKEIILKIGRSDKIIEIKTIPRMEIPDGQGPLGVSLVQTQIVKYPWYKAAWLGLKTTVGLTMAILTALFEIIKNLFIGQTAGIDISGPVGIAVLTKKVAGLGLVYILQFAALLSINLGIINVLPFPALDGGRILFILIEKIKGSAVSQKIEQAFHTVGFILLILLLIFVTFRDVAKFIK
jgi:regulator of sigma E protease